MQDLQQAPCVELSVPWSVAEADAALNTCSGRKKAGQAVWDECWHGPLALLRLALEQQPLNEVPRSARCTVCKIDIRSNKEHPLPGSLAKHLASVDHRWKLQGLRCGDSSCILPEALKVLLKSQFYCMSLLSGAQDFGDISENMGDSGRVSNASTFVSLFYTFSCIFAKLAEDSPLPVSCCSGDGKRPQSPWRWSLRVSLGPLGP